MTDQQTRPLFRPEAVEAHARGRSFDDDEGLDLKEGQTTWAFRLLILGLVVTVLAALTVKVEETARGNVVVSGGRTVVHLPITAAPRVARGQPVRLGDARGTVDRIGEPVAPTDGGDPFVPVVVKVTQGTAAEGEASVRLSRRTLASLLLKGRGNG